MRLTENLKGIVDIQTLILIELLYHENGGCSGSMGVSAISESSSIDRATVRRNLKGDGIHVSSPNSLIGKGFVAEVLVDGECEYNLTEEGRAEVFIRLSKLSEIKVFDQGVN